MHIESLESRQLFSNSVLIGSVAPIKGVVLAPPNLDPNLAIRDATRLVSGTLYITGNDNPDTITVTPVAPIVFKSAIVSKSIVKPISVFVPSLKVSRDLVVNTFALSAVKKIVIEGFKGGDVLTLDPSIAVPAVIYGGDGDDFIEGGAGNDSISGDAGNNKIFGNGGNDAISTVSGNDTVFGGDGNDNITGGAGNEYLDGGAGNDVIYGQGGNDQIFGGDGTDNLYGGPGNDTIVSVFGGTDSVHGDAGWDTFVADKTDTIYDADTMAIARNSVYRINQFTNPTVAGAHPVYATDLGKTSIAEPTFTSAAVKYQDFTGTPVFTSQGPQMTDIQQGQVDDCWFEATAAGVAQSTPWVIRRSVVDLGDGTYMVGLGSNVYRVDGELPVDSKGKPAYAKVSRPNGDSLWFPLMEKALAYYVSSATNAKYSAVVASLPGRAYDALRVSYDSHTLVSALGFGTDSDEMWNYINSNKGKSMVIDTEPSWLGVVSSLVPSHAYTVMDTYSIGTKKMVLIRNPWAYNGTDHTNDGQLNISADDLYSSCDELYIAS
jgi:Calpain family cysteine protease/RTX calcium-binding nonapeptide repeat (4 copies)